ncbi:chromatin assembly factor 1 subunit A-like isoform X2 [Rhopalosiphum padi]|uniref:chromatin assembly factor 1 subunit A-like isoform X2 n=1 Tax=Rhopalosiphum padi TaxID=40932 RepID=UPI00298ECA47|nr:chromatin assembly factor 1 subunit A-like isoform X2 [Rhopalosiphum padi]
MSSSKAVEKSAKKLVQKCLPFKLVNSPGDDANSKCRKRKLSGTENDETRVENPKVELLNGGTKCFIKSDDEEKKINGESSEDDMGAKESVSSIIAKSENIIEKVYEEINDVPKTDESIKDVDDTISTSSDTDIACNDISVNSTSDSGKLENTTPSSKKLTPQQILKRQESAKRNEERERIKQEKLKAREEKLKEQAEKQRLKEQKRIAEIEAKRLRELEKKQKEEEKKAKELEKELERKQKEEEKKAKDLEKEKERKQKEDERKAKELEKEKQKEKEEMEKKKKEKVKAAFVGFFKPKNLNLEISKKDDEICNQELETYFMPFQTKQDMKIAPICRAYLNIDKLKIVDKCISHCEKNKDLLYLSLLKTGKHKPSKSDATWPIQVEDDTDVIIIETGSTNNEDVNKVGTTLRKNSQKFRWKLLQFDENKRPPYWGTWRKKSLYVKPKRPFACDKIMFDYEIDSDDEWEEEDPGESIHGTDNEEEPEDEYEVDNDVFVPHGYLSDEEGQDNDSDTEEVQQEKLKLLGEEFEAEIKKKTERIKPRLVGCIWIPNNVTNSKNVNKSIADTLLKYRCVWDEEEPIITKAEIKVDSPRDLTATETKKTKILPDSIIPDLITFIHGNTNGMKLAVKNFIDELVKNGRNTDDDNAISLSTVKKTIKSIATKSTHVAPWCVSKENFEKYGVEYPTNLENEVQKSKPSVKKITSFMTPQNQKAKVNLLEKSCGEMDQNVTESKKDVFIPKNLFNTKESTKPPVMDIIKEGQKINIVGGKKRITPILLSPKKKIKSMVDRKFKEKSLSPDMDEVCEDIPIPNIKTV